MCDEVTVGNLAAGRRIHRVRARFIVSLGLALAGCSSFSSPPASSSSAAPSSPPPDTAGTLRQSYVDFLNMFRDQPTPAPTAAPPPNAPRAAAGQPGYAAPYGSVQPVAAAAPAPPAAAAPAAAPSSPSGFASSTAPGIAGPASVRGGPNFGTGSPAPPAGDSGPSGLLVDVFKPKSTPSAQPVAAPPPPSTYASPASVGGAGPATGRGSVTAGVAPAAAPAQDTGPSGLLVELFRSNPTPAAAPSNVPRPPSTYTASAPPYTPPPTSSQ